MGLKLTHEPADLDTFVKRAAIYWILTVFLGLGAMVMMPNIVHQHRVATESLQLTKEMSVVLQQNKEEAKLNRIAIEENQKEVIESKQLSKENLAYAKEIRDTLQSLVNGTNELENQQELEKE